MVPTWAVAGLFYLISGPKLSDFTSGVFGYKVNDVM